MITYAKCSWLHTEPLSWEVYAGAIIPSSPFILSLNNLRVWSLNNNRMGVQLLGVGIFHKLEFITPVEPTHSSPSSCLTTKLLFHIFRLFIGLWHHDRWTRSVALGRAEAADSHRAVVAAGTGSPPSGRGHVRPGPPLWEAGAGGPGQSQYWPNHSHRVSQVKQYEIRLRVFWQKTTSPMNIFSVLQGV